MLAAGANINYQNKNNDTALMISIGHPINVTKTLINAGANVNMQDKNGVTALMLGKLFIILFTLCIYFIPLATSNGFDNAVEALIEANANIYLQNQKGYTAVAYGIKIT